MAATIDREFLKYFLLLDESQKKSLIEMMKSFLKPGAEKINKASLEQYNKELDEAMERMNKGLFITINDLEKEMQTW